MPPPSQPRFSIKFDVHVPEFYRIFTLLDYNKDAVLDYKDLELLFKRVGYQCSRAEVEDLLLSMRQSVNATGLSSSEQQQPHSSVDFAVFIAWIYQSLQSNSLESQLSAVFNLLDANADGEVSCNEVGALLERLDVPVSKEDAQQILNGCGEVDFNRFCQLIRKAIPQPAQMPTRDV